MKIGASSENVFEYLIDIGIEIFHQKKERNLT